MWAGLASVRGNSSQAKRYTRMVFAYSEHLERCRRGCMCRFPNTSVFPLGAPVAVWDIKWTRRLGQLVQAPFKHKNAVSEPQHCLCPPVKAPTLPAPTSVG
jgi:hypothetical protein